MKMIPQHKKKKKMRDAAKAVFRGKFKRWSVHIRKEKKINSLSLNLKIQEKKNKLNPKQTEGMNK